MNKYMTIGFLFSSTFDKVVLIKKTKPEWQFGKLNGVGGKSEDFDDSINHTMSREFKEETSVYVPPENWEYYAEMIGPDWNVHCFYSIDDNLIYGVKTTTGEEVCIIDTSELSELNIISNLSFLIPAAKNHKESQSLDKIIIYYR